MKKNCHCEHPKLCNQQKYFQRGHAVLTNQDAFLLYSLTVQSSFLKRFFLSVREALHYNMNKEPLTIFLKG